MQAPNSNADDEISHCDAMKALLSSSKFCDVELIGSDKVVVSAGRSVLASRSKVFERMLYGDLCEAQNSTIELPYPGRVVLECLVSYIYTDEFQLGLEKGVVGIPDIQQFVSNVVGLFDAGTYFQLPCLCQQVEVLATAATTSSNVNSVMLAVEMLNASEMFAPCTLVSLVSAAADKIHSRPEIFCDASKARHLNPHAMGVILRHQPLSLTVEELALFKILLAWSKVVDDDDDETTTTAKKRKDQAALLAEHLILKNINPIDLSTTVAPSGLVSEKQLCEAFQSQAFAAEPAPPRGPPTWINTRSLEYTSSSTSYELRCVKCPIMRTGGVWKWSMEVLEWGSNYMVWFGVASTEHDFDMGHTFTGVKGCQWMISQSGQVRSSSEVDRWDVEIWCGDVVQFCLDLTKYGTLTVSIAASEMCHEISCRMLEEFEGLDAVGFLPAAVVKKPARVKFLGFES